MLLCKSLSDFKHISHLSNYTMTKLPPQTKKTDYILDSNVDKEEQLQRTLHTEVRTEFLYLTRSFVSHIEKMIVSEDGITLLCTDKKEHEIMTEAAKYINSCIFQGKTSIMYVTEDSSSNIQTSFPTDVQIRDGMHQQCRKRCNNKNANDKIKTKKLKRGNQVVEDSKDVQQKEAEDIDSDNEKEIQQA